MSSKTFCLRCEKVNSCSCGSIDNIFSFSHKLRPPKTDNKVKFRKFLDNCPEFVNCVPDELKMNFIALLKKVKYFNKSINGQKWTIIEK